MKKSISVWIPAFLAVLSMSDSVHAAQVDMTSFASWYNDGGTWTAGVPTGWADTITSGSIQIQNSSTLGDGPHNDLYLGNSLENFVATVNISASSTSSFDGTFGGFYLDTSNGYFGVTFGTNSLATQYGFTGMSPIYIFDGNYDLSSAELRFIRDNGTFTAQYSIDGVNFVTLYDLIGVEGTTQFDLTSYGGATGLTATFSNLQISALPAVPEPSAWMLMGLGVGLIGFALRRRQALAVRTA